MLYVDFEPIGNVVFIRFPKKIIWKDNAILRFKIRFVETTEFMITFLCSFSLLIWGRCMFWDLLKLFFGCFFFYIFLDIPGHAWGGYPGSLDNKVILIYVSQQRFFKWHTAIELLQLHLSANVKQMGQWIINWKINTCSG